LIARHASQPLAVSNRRRQLRAVKLLQQWLVVKQVVLRRTTTLKQVDNAFGTRRKVRSWRSIVVGKQRRQRCSPQTSGAARQQQSSSNGLAHRCLTTSSKFINMLITIVHAATSTTSTSVAGGRSPIAAVSCARQGAARYRSRCSSNADCRIESSTARGARMVSRRNAAI